MNRWMLTAGAAVLTAATTLTMAAPFGPATMPAEIGKMVPDGSFVLAYSSSISGLQQTLSRSVSDVEPQMGMMVAMAGPASSLNMMVKKEGQGPGSAGIKMDGPIAFFVGPKTGTGPSQQPLGGAIFEVADAGSITTTQPSMILTRLPGTNWVAISNAQYTLPSSASTMGSGMLDADISVNIDQQLLVKEYKNEIDGMLGMMSMPSSAGAKGASRLHASQEANVRNIKKFLGHYASWNVGIDLDGAAIDMLCRSHPVNPADVKVGDGSLATVAGRIPAGMPIQGALDTAFLHALMEYSDSDANTAGLPPEWQEVIKKLMEESLTSMKLVKGGTVFGLSFGTKGMNLVQVTGTTDPQAMITSAERMITALDDAEIGLHFADRPVDDGVAWTLTLNAHELMATMDIDQFLPEHMDKEQKAKFDMEMAQAAMAIQMFTDVLFGEGGWPIEYVVEGDQVLTLGGHDTALMAETRKTASQGGESNALSALLTNALATPSWAFDLDARKVADQVLRAIAASPAPFAAMVPPKAPAGPAVPFSMVGSSNGTWEQFRLRTNAKDWYQLGKDFQPKPGPQATGVLIAD